MVPLISVNHIINETTSWIIKNYNEYKVVSSSSSTVGTNSNTVGVSNSCNTKYRDIDLVKVDTDSVDG